MPLYIELEMSRRDAEKLIEAIKTGEAAQLGVATAEHPEQGTIELPPVFQEFLKSAFLKSELDELDPSINKPKPKKDRPPFREQTG